MNYGHYSSLYYKYQRSSERLNAPKSNKYVTNSVSCWYPTFQFCIQNTVRIASLKQFCILTSVKGYSTLAVNSNVNRIATKSYFLKSLLSSTYKYFVLCTTNLLFKNLNFVHRINALSKLDFTRNPSFKIVLRYKTLHLL
jgi:hypothetical protein